jgi:hypothetical protein
MENQVMETEMISVSQVYLNGLLRTIQDLKEHVRGLENMNEELVAAMNEKD